MTDTRPDVTSPSFTTHALLLAAVADVTATHAQELARRLAQQHQPDAIIAGPLLTKAYAEAVRDTLRWLTGDAPTDMLTTTLGLPQEA